MLYFESPVTFEDVTFYRDYSDEKLFYYLPKDVLIGKDAEALHFSIFTDKTIRDEDLPNLDVRNIGGFINLESVLGPITDDLDKAKEKLKEFAGDDVRITPVPFEKGSVNLAIMGKSSENKEKDVMEIEIVGSGKPCLTGNHQSAFNLRLGGNAAQIVYDLLNNTPQTQMAVFYEMEYLGVTPAYNVEITVDFKATEKYINNNIDLDFDLEAKDKNLKVLVEADIDSVIQELVNNGSITIKETDYTEGNRFNEGVTNKVELIKTLLGTELFNPTIMPTSPNAILKDTMNSAGDGKDGKDANGQGKAGDGKDAKDGKDANGQGKAGNGKDGKDGGATGGKAPNGQGNTNNSNSGKNNGPIPDRTNDAVPAGDKAPSNNPTGGNPATGNNPTGNNPATGNNPTGDNPANGDNPTGEGTTTGGDNPDGDSTGGNNNGESDDEKKKKSDLYITAKLGYTLKHRQLSEQVTRTFHFNRSEVKRLPFAISGILSTANSKFDPTKQVHITNLGVGEFHETKLSFSPSVSFADYGITKAKVEWHLQDMPEWNSILFEKENGTYKRSLIHNDEQYPNLIYKASFATNDFGVVNTKEITTTDRDIFVVLDNLEDKRFVKVRTGNLKDVSNIIVKILPDGKEDNNMQSCCLTSEKPNQPLMINKCEYYDVVIEYPQSTGKPQQVTYSHQTALDFVVYQPNTVRVILDEAAFADDTVKQIRIKIAYNNGPTKLLVFTPTKMEATFTFDYEANSLQEGVIKAEYQKIHADRTIEDAGSEEFSGDTPEIYPIIF